MQLLLITENYGERSQCGEETVKRINRDIFNQDIWHKSFFGLRPTFKGYTASVDYAFESAKREIPAFMKWHDDLFFRLGMTPLLMASLATDKQKPIMSKNTDNFIWFKAGVFGTQS